MMIKLKNIFVRESSSTVTSWIIFSGFSPNYDYAVIVVASGDSTSVDGVVGVP